MSRKPEYTIERDLGVLVTGKTSKRGRRRAIVFDPSKANSSEGKHGEKVKIVDISDLLEVLKVKI